MTQGAVPVVPYRYFGDKFLETDDFFGRLPTEIVKYMAVRGINMPEPAIMSAMAPGHITDFLMIPLKEAFVNVLLKRVDKKERDRIKKLLANHKWDFPEDTPKIRDTIYS